MGRALGRACLVPIMAVAMASAIACGGGASANKAPTSAAKSASASQATRQPLSNAEKRWIVEIGRKLQSETQPDPSEVTRAVERISGASGFTVVLCGDILQLLMQEQAEIDLVGIVLVGSAAAMIESPELTDNLPRMMSNGLRAAAQAYRTSRGTKGRVIQSLEELEARDRDGTLESWVEARWTCPSTVEAAIAQQRKEGDVLVVLPDSTASSGERPWGVSVPDAAQEARVLAVMKAIANSKASADVLSTLFTIGPALYKSLLGVDKELGRDTVTTIGTTTIAVVPVGERQLKMPMRTYLEQEHREALLKASPFRGIALAISEGKSRAATEAERQLLYALVAFEIADAPVTVIEMQGHLVVAYFDGDKLMWLDILSDYQPL